MYKKIVIVNRHRDDKIGGSELQCDLIASELAIRGHEVVYIVPGGKGPYQNDRDYRIIPCEDNGEKIAEKTINEQPEIVYWRYNKRNFYDAVSRMDRAGLTVIFSSSSEEDVKKGLSNKKKLSIRKKVKLYLRKRKNYRGFNHVKAVVVNNISHLNKLPVPYQTFIPNGVICTRIPFQWNRPYCAWISSLKQIKRPELLLELANQFKGRNIDFIMVGEIQEEEYSWFAEKSHLPENVHYLGVKTPEEVNGILYGSELHIHTCFPEGFPNVFIQAWTQETPSVSLGYDPSGYITKHKMGGYAKNDFNTFVKLTDKYLTHPELAKEAGRNARTFANSMFDTKKSVDMLEEVFKQVNSSEGYQLKVKKQGIPLT